MKLSRDIISKTAERMLNELESNRLEVVLIPDWHGSYQRNHKRVACSKNAAWYRDFCSLYERSRRNRIKPDTLINRKPTIKALKKLMNGVNDSIYTERLLDYMEENHGLVDISPSLHFILYSGLPCEA